MWPELIQQDVYGFLLVFSRIGAVFMFMPALGSGNIPARFRLTMGLMISFMIYLVVHDKIPAMPEQIIELVVVIFLEASKGIMIAMAARTIHAALHVSGTIIGFQSGFAAAQQFDPNQGQQGATLAAFFSFLGILVIFTTDLHLLLIEALFNSYVIFPASAPIIWGDFAMVITNAMASAFMLGVQLSAPFIVYALIYNVSLGLVARLMPQLPVFFVGMPINLFVGLLLLSFLISGMMMWFGQHFENYIFTLFG